MSKVIRATGNRPLSHIVKIEARALTGYYYVDSNDTFDCGYETMVFPYDIKENEVASWLEIWCMHYETQEQMEFTHNFVCNNLEQFITPEPGDHGVIEEESA